MEAFFRTHTYLVEHTDAPVRRLLMDEIDWNDRLIGIKGTRGVGKTTFLLQYAKENLSRTKKFWILFAVIIFSLFIVFIGLLILQSYRLYTTLDWLYISMTKEKIIITIIGCIASFLVTFIFYDWLVQICNQTLFYEFNQNLKNFPIFDKKITMDYNWYLLFISFIILGIGEFFNGKKIQRFFKKLFKKV